MTRETRAVVRKSDGVVVNVVEYDPDGEWTAPVGMVAVPWRDGAAVDGIYDEAADTFAPAPGPPLEDVRATAIERVDAQAEGERSRWITMESGQALICEAKRREAEAWAIAISPRTLAGYPFMRGRAARLNGVPEADATEAQMQAVADEWLAKSAAWRDAGIAIEAVREQAKEDIAAAPDAAAVHAVLEGLAWPALQDGGD